MVAITHPGSLGSLSIAGPARRSHPGPAVYRRRRLALVGVLALVLALGLALASLVTAPRSPSAPSLGTPVARVSVVVQPGDTVWSVASDVSGGDDPRPIVDAIVAANGGADLVAGQRLDITVP